MRNSENVVNQATIFPIETSKEEIVYTGISDGNWKQRFYNYFSTLTQKPKGPIEVIWEYER